MDRKMIGLYGAQNHNFDKLDVTNTSKLAKDARSKHPSPNLRQSIIGEENPLNFQHPPMQDHEKSQQVSMKILQTIDLKDVAPQRRQILSTDEYIDQQFESLNFDKTAMQRLSTMS